MSRTYLEIFEKARTLIAQPENWTKKEDARNAQGEAVNIRDVHAVKWCAMGAIRREIAPTTRETIDIVTVRMMARLRSILRDASGCVHILPTEWNDAPERTHAEVLTAFDNAIEALKT